MNKGLAFGQGYPILLGRLQRTIGRFSLVCNADIYKTNTAIQCFSKYSTLYQKWTTALTKCMHDIHMKHYTRGPTINNDLGGANYITVYVHITFLRVKQDFDTIITIRDIEAFKLFSLRTIGSS